MRKGEEKEGEREERDGAYFLVQIGREFSG